MSKKASQEKPATAEEKKPVEDVQVEQSALGRRWVLEPADPKRTQNLMRKGDVSLIIAEILNARGITEDDVLDYLDPKIKEMMPDPSIMKGMDDAVKRIANAIDRGENIAVFGDFDVDGATSSALLKKYFAAIGRDIEIYIPHRVKEGYGPQIDAFKALQKDKKVSLIITVDCGASAHSVIGEANDLGLSTIVFDHHQAYGELPPAHAVVNPNHESDDCGLNYLAGCGVTFMAIVALNRELKKRKFFEKQGLNPPNLMKLMDLVALGTVADVMPIIGLNRAFVRQGLKVMNERHNMGLKLLMNAADFKGEPVVHTIGFVLGPRINAGGRLGDVPDLGARLLSTTSMNEAAHIANELNEINLQRRQEQEDALKEIYSDNRHITDDFFIALADENWHPGIIGIMAGRIKDECYKPAAVMTYDEKLGLWKGSARSVEQIDLGRLIHDAVDAGILEGGGGHKMAAGFSLKEENIEKFKAFMNEKIKQALNSEPLVETQKVTSIISHSAVNMALAKELEILEPCGQGNPKPTFALTNVKVKKIKVQKDKGDSDFFILILSDDTGQGYLEAKLFVKKDSDLHRLVTDPSQPTLHLLGSVSVNEFLGNTKVQFDVKDAVKDSPDLPLKKKCEVGTDSPKEQTEEQDKKPTKKRTRTPKPRTPSP